MTVTVCPINPPGHDWENGLSCRWCEATRTPQDAVLSQLASRRGGNSEAARVLLDAYRAQVLAEAAALADPKAPEVSFFGNYGPQVAWWLRMLAGGHERAATQAAPVTGFFQPGHTYAEPDGRTDWRFHCATVTTHPASGERQAIGWIQISDGSWTAYAYSAPEWGGKWVDVTEAGAR